MGLVSRKLLTNTNKTIVTSFISLKMDDLQYIAAIEDPEIAEQPVESHNRFGNLNPFEILNEHQFLQTFRVTKKLCTSVMDTLTPFTIPQRRATDLSIPIQLP
ncbi:hypothetical protein JTB14_034588 [Gonioctena quinquepunctata]|nr:hypothetical protein JTB14_034588 [Gonioctena quinquepunctata]